MERTTNMTSGSPTKLILRFAFPLILTNLGQQLYTIVDAVIVGRGVGVQALAALGATDWLYWAVLWAVQAMTQGFAVLVSQTFGSGNKQDFRKAITMSILLCAIIGAILTAAGIALALPMLQLLKTPNNILAGARTYLTTMYAGTLIVMAYNMSAGFLRSVGDGKSPLIAMGIAGSCNIVLDLLFVLVFRWGIIGAAFANAARAADRVCILPVRDCAHVGVFAVPRGLDAGWRSHGDAMPIGHPASTGADDRRCRRHCGAVRHQYLRLCRCGRLHRDQQATRPARLLGNCARRCDIYFYRTKLGRKPA